MEGTVLRTDALDYELPPALIATQPVTPRDAARLMVLRASDPDAIEHARVSDLPALLHAGDRIVFNTTRVLPARFRGVREDTGGRVEGLYLHDATELGCWIAMIKSRRHKPGALVRLSDAEGPTPFALEMIEPVDDPPGAWRLRLHAAPGEPSNAPEVLERVGLTPLPPYILSARRSGEETEDDAEDRERYQTVYAGGDSASVAAPTAGLHFTPEVLAGLEARGVARSDVLLHVGAGTFKPVETEHVEEHPIHSEWCSASPQVLADIRTTRSAGGRVVAVGTTTVRTLEAYAEAGEPPPPDLSTRLLITPGRGSAFTDALMTNFHLPRSTLMALVAAFLQRPDEPPEPSGEPPGVTRLKRAYAEAIHRGYRFYSFGDAMLILP